MPGDYWTLLASLIIAYRSGDRFWHQDGNWKPRALTATMWIGGGMMLFVAQSHLTFMTLTIGWVMSGLILMLQAGRHILLKDTPIPLWAGSVDAAGSWLALLLAGGNPWAIIAGLVAGVALPVATGPWPRAMLPLSAVFEALVMGAVGLRTLALVAWGNAAESLPLWLLMVPWLIVWELRLAGAPAS